MVERAAQEAVDRLLAEALADNTAGRHRAAHRAVLRALRIVDTWAPEAREPMRARLLITAALSTLELRGREEALDQLAQARDLAGRHDRPALLGLAFIQEGTIHSRCADWAATVTATECAQRYGDLLTPPQQYAAALNKGLAELSLLRFGPARHDLETALAIAVREERREHEFKARHNLGCLAYFEGDLPRALQLMAAADAMPVDVSRARAKADYAQVLIEAGLVEQARDVLVEGLQAAQSDHLRIELGQIHLDLGRCALLLGDLPKARRHTSAAIRAYRSRATEGRRRSALLARAAIDAATGAGPSAVSAATEPWLAVPRPRLPEERLAASVAAETALTAGDLESAETMMRRLRLSAPTSPAADLHERLLESRLALASGNPGAARRALRAASGVLARHQDQVHSLDVRAGLALHGERLRDLDLRTALAGGHPAAVLESVERWRATSHRLPPVSPEPDHTTAALIAELRRLRSPVAPPLDLGEEDREASAIRLERRIARRDWGAAGRSTGTAASPVTARQVRRVATVRGASVVSFVAVGGDLLRLLVDADGVRCDHVASAGRVAELSQQLSRDLAAATAVPPGSPLARTIGSAVLASARGLGEVLLPRGWSDRRPTRVVVAPSRGLTATPWSLLPPLHGLPVTVVPSVTRWVTASAMSVPRPATTCVALAGPGLERALDEVHAVAALWGASENGRDPGRLATSGEVVGALSSADLVHLAAHGTHQEANPLFSSLRMSDGPVFAHELPRPLRTEHVVLSACDVGRSRLRHGDEPLGLTAALLALGVRSVVAAVAPVRDEAAAEAMTAYHRELVTGTDAATALARALGQVPAARALCLFGADWSAALEQRH